MTFENLNLDLYKLLIEDVRDARRARRELSNIFMTLNIAGMSALGFLARPDAGLQDPLLFSLCALALATTTVIWRTSNSYYRVLLNAKYVNIYDLEQKLGIDPIQKEWATIQATHEASRFFSMERGMPVLFLIGYAVFFAVHIGRDNWDIIIANLQVAFDAIAQWVRSLSSGSPHS
ncbi:MAG: hypothetical protein IPL62_06460 [Caulobacteraceae bacterium]|nr:hypothetical protein [Caulobacteraceae bacterium]